MARPFTDTEYHSLREQIQEILREGRVQSRQAGEWGKVETYWQIGDALYVGIFGRRERAPFGASVIANLARDLHLRRDLLHDLVLFRRALPVVGTYRQLGWSHYRVIIRLPTQDQRRFYERLAGQQRWSVRELKARIRGDVYQEAVQQPFAVAPDEDPFAGRPLRSSMGQLHTYQIIRSRRRRSTALVLDLGFHIHWRVDFRDLDSPAPGMTVTSTQTAGQYHFSVDRSHRQKLWTYVAYVDRIVDGDTLDVVVDCGFDHESPRRLRLRGIDAPELYWKAGRRAKAFVEQVAASVDFVVLTTRKTDKYGRYLADVVYLPGEPDPQVVLDKGTFLNRQLLEERLARRYLD